MMSWDKLPQRKDLPVGGATAAHQKRYDQCATTPKSPLPRPRIH